jgi:SAM-dependent methyltransferase
VTVARIERVTDPFPPRTPTESAALARLYDLDLVEDPGDVDLYLALASRTGGPVLELAVGTGRIAVPLAEAGHHVTGVDLDPSMLERARSAAAAGGVQDRLELVEADMVGLALPSAGTFGLAFIALNSLLLLAERRLQRDALRVLARHLRPGGLAVVDVWQPDAEDLGRFDGRLILEYLRRDPSAGTQVTKAGAAVHDPSTQTVTLTTLYEESRPGEPVGRWLRRDRLRLVSADELAGFAEDAGLQTEVVAGSYDLDPLGPTSERAILVAVRP